MPDRIVLIPDETQQAIVADYQAGKKLREIQETHAVTRSQVYWVIEQQAVSPARTKPASRLDDGDPITTEKLYKILQAQDERIQLYEGYMKEMIGWVLAICEASEDCSTDEANAVSRKKIKDLVAEVTPFLEVRAV